MKILEHKCFGLDDSMIKTNGELQHIIFKIDNGKYIYKKLRRIDDEVKEFRLYYSDEESFNKEDYNERKDVWEGTPMVQLSTDKWKFDEVSSDETELVEQYFKEHNLRLIK